ncbi:MAG: hypothetical protein JST07_11215 [Bacteroidetes bacterium]|nr:hypothetical protein [Bacteroidota bacterium]
MGGNALKFIQTFRKPKNEYEEIKKIIISKIEDYISAHSAENIKYGLIKEAPEKEDFGDLDILISGTVENLYKLIEYFEPDEIQRSGHIFSFNYKDFQIDFLQTENIEMAQFFYNFGDIGSILGRIFSTLGFKFGQKGLSLKIYDDFLYKKNNEGELFLSNNPSEICKYFYYDYDRWLHSFSSLEECFEWIVSSKYFRKSIFLGVENKKHKKSNQRPFYINFIKYIESSNIKYTKYCNLNPAIDYFNKQTQYNSLKKEIEMKKIIHAKFNGDIFNMLGYSIEKNNLSLGKFMDKFKAEFNGVDFDNFIIETPQEEINNMIQKFIETN